MSIPLNEAFLLLDPGAATYTRLPVIAKSLSANPGFLSGLRKEFARTQ